MTYAVFSLILSIGLILWLCTASVAIAKSVVTKWARDNGYELIEQTHKFWSHPFKWRTILNPRSHVFRIVVKEKQGVVRTGWIRVPFRFFKENVVWDA
jgi:hypothetical protein